MAPNPSSWRSVWLLSVMLGLLPLLWVPVSQGQTTSITSSGLNTTITRSSVDPAGRQNYDITGGTRPGDGPNLFHSFDDFSVGTNNVARFLNDTGRSTTNILSRVTGGNPSSIFGEIQTTNFPGANLFLFNPAGVVFGPNASLNVGGAAHFSTADYLRLGSGNDRFYADLGKTSQLTSAPVTAFGFLAEGAKGPITVRAGNPLTVKEGKGISLIGGDISITGRTMSAPGGQINVASVAGSGEVVPNQAGQAPSLGLVNVSKQGTIQLTEGTILRTSSSTGDAGPVFIRSGQFVMDNAGIEAITTAPSPGEIDPQLTGGVVDILSDSIAIRGGAVQTELGFSSTFPGFARDPGTLKASGLSILTNNKGDITLASSDVTLDKVKIVSYGQQIVSILAGSATGQIQIRGMQGAHSLADQVTIRNKSLLHTAGTASDCDCVVFGRDVSIQTRNFDMADSRLSTTQGIVTVFAENELFSVGGNTYQKDAIVRNLRAGENDIELTAGKRVVLGQGDLIASRTGGDIFAVGGSQAGDIVVKAPFISMNGTTVEADGGVIVRGGTIAIRADQTEITGSRLSTNGLDGTPQPDSGTAGSIRITGMQDGVKAEGITLVNSTVESLVTQAGSNLGVFGKSGTITLEGNNVLLDGSTVSVDHAGAGQSGSIIVNAGKLTLTNGSSLTSAASGKDYFSDSFPFFIPAAPAGPISVRVNQVDLKNGSNISASSTGDGSAGSVTMGGTNGPGSLVILDNSSISTTISGSGEIFPISGGYIDLSAQTIRLVNGARITADTSGDTPAGSIILHAANVATSNVVISSSSTSPGTSAGGAGEIVIEGKGESFAESVNLDNSILRTTSKGGNFEPGRGRGHISLLARSISLENGTHIEADTSGGAPAGAILFQGSGSFAASNGARISSTSTGTGHAGNILVVSGNAFIENSALSTSATQASAGNISVKAPNMVRLNNAQLTSTTESGTGGSISLNTKQISLDNAKVSTTVTGGTNSTRTPADITVMSGTFSMNGGAVTAETNGAARAGNIKVNVGGPMTLTNGADISSSSTAVSSTRSAPGGAGSLVLTAGSQFQADGATVKSSALDGGGGTVEIRASDIAINNGSLVSTNTTGANDAGNILLTSRNNLSITSSTVSTSAAEASGGNIELTAPNLVRLVGANLTSSVNGTANSNGGNITINTAHPQFVIMQNNSQILAKANEGQGGRITIIAGVVLQEPGSVLDATAGPAGISGSINIQAPIQQLSGAIAPLPQAFAVATNLYGQRCAAEKGGQFSSFVQGARDGVPPQPGDLIPSPLMLDDGTPFSSSSQSTPSLSAIRLGLPEFEQTAHSSLTVFAGCRS